MGAMSSYIVEKLVIIESSQGYIYLFCCFVFCIETGSHYVTHDDLKFAISIKPASNLQRYT